MLDPLIIPRVYLRSDSMTGAENMLAFFEWLWRYTKDHPVNPFSLISLDVIELKELNDKYGFAAGDAALRWITLVLQEEGDAIVYRISGDEFVGVLVDGNREDHIKRCEKVKKRLEDEAGQVNLADQPARVVLIHFPSLESSSPEDVLSLVYGALLKSKLEKIMRAGEYKSYAHLYQAIKKNDAECVELLSKHITTNHTFFFRERTHLKILTNDILIRKKDHVLIWCAACATGEEVYSMIIALLEAGIYNFSILASDINRESLIHLKRGIYQGNRLKFVEKDILKKYFLKRQGADYYRVKKGLKQYFIIKRLNLIDNLMFEQQFDYIFCRNVLMYFNRETQTAVVLQLLRNLEDYGYLFIGQSESLLHMSEEVESVFSSVYNKKL